MTDLRELGTEEIHRFANRQGVKRIAVENFLMTVTNNDTINNAIANLAADAKVYNWNKPTIKAIADGIALSAGVP